MGIAGKKNECSAVGARRRLSPQRQRSAFSRQVVISRNGDARYPSASDINDLRVVIYDRRKEMKSSV